MTVDKLIEKYGIGYYIDGFGWAGGTIHQVREEIKKNIIKKGGKIEEKTGEIIL